MRLYCYTFHGEKIMQEGYLSAANNPDPQQLSVYAKRARTEDKEGIKRYLDSIFQGRSRSICCLTEKAPPGEYKHPYLNNLVQNAEVVSFDWETLIKDGLVEAIYCKDCLENAKAELETENIYKAETANDIDTAPLNCHGCDEKYGAPYNSCAIICWC